MSEIAAIVLAAFCLVEGIFLVCSMRDVKALRRREAQLGGALMQSKYDLMNAATVIRRLGKNPLDHEEQAKRFDAAAKAANDAFYETHGNG